MLNNFPFIVKAMSFSLTVCMTLAGLSTKGQEKVLKFDNYSKDDGLFHSYVLDVIQDSEGYIWTGSYGGLNKFDGTQLTGFNTRSGKGMPTDAVFSLLEPSKGEPNTLWLGTNLGMVLYTKPTASFKLFPFEGSDVINMVETPDGTLWLGTAQDGLIKFDPQSGSYSHTSLSRKRGQSWGAEITAMHLDKMGNLWIGARNGGLLLYNPEQDQFDQFRIDGDAGQTITCIYKYQNRLLIGTSDDGIHVFDKTKQVFSKVNAVEGALDIFTSISGIAPDHEGDLWIATLGGGLYECSIRDENDGTVSVTSAIRYTKNACGGIGIGSNMLNVMEKDKTGNLWVGSLGGGLSKIDFYSHRFEHLRLAAPTDDFSDRTTVLSVSQGDDQNIWYGTQADGIYIYDSDLKPVKHLPLNGSVVRQIHKDHKGRMWASVLGGIYVFNKDGSRQKFYDLEALDMPYATVHALAVDNNDQLWFGVYDHGVFKVQLPKDVFSSPIPTNPAHYHNSPDSAFGNLGSNRIWAIHKGKEGNIWVGSDKGLDIYNPTTNAFKHVLKGNVNSIMEPEKVKTNSLWVGTFGGGVHLLNKTDYATINFSTDNGLANNNINGIMEDVTGKIWVATEKGICSIDPNGYYNTDLTSLTSEQVNANRVKQYFMYDGLQGNEFHLNANQRLIDGRIVVGGPNGVNVFDPKNILINTFAYPARIHDILINNTSITADSTYELTPAFTKQLDLTYAQNSFAVEYGQVCLSTPGEATYQYMLEGFDSDWIDADANDTKINYTSLPQGKYTLKIKAINPDGFPAKDTTELVIKIAAPWYATIWFRVIMSLGFIALIYIGYKMVIARADNKKKAELAAQEEHHQREKLEVDLEYKNRELAASAMYLINRNEKLIEIKTLVEDTMRKTGNKNNPELNKVIMTIDHVLKHKDDWEKFEKNFNRIDSNFTQRLLEAFPKLSTNDVKICTYMRMNLSSKEIAGLLNITTKSLETSRLRIRKKIDLESSIYLSDFILKF